KLHISGINKQAFTLRELTPFHVTDQDVERNEGSLHFPVRSDAERLGQILPSADPLAIGIEITPIPPEEPSSPPRKETPPPKTERRNRWSFDDDK
ncbi:hypothetical protein, partial [Leisingera sp. MMG026]|uniref:hypothetical protein n=1 Tax=Leisingera sp. MMG026 TaxID=2909982 RepID=UPI001F40FD34